MGKTREDIKTLINLHKNGVLDFSKKLSIVDLGTSQIHYDVPGKTGTTASGSFVEFEDAKMSNEEFLKYVFTTFEKPNISLSGYQSGMLVKKFYDDLGFDYVAIDLDTYNGSDFVLNYDLNEAQCPPEQKNKYDLVTNYGTTEHLINQTNAFKMIHDLCKVNGVMINTVPSYDIGHGFFNYTSMFFKSLAKDNNYDIISMNTQNVYEGGNLKSIYLFLVMRKTSDADFVQPAEVFDSGVYTRHSSNPILHPRDDIVILK